MLTSISPELPSSPATVTETKAQNSSVDDIFGTSATGPAPASNQAAPPNPPAKSGFEDLEDEFEGLEDAKEGSGEEDFANISRSGLDDFNPVFDSSPPGSQTKTESTAFGNESFDFISASQAGPAQPPAGGQQKPPEAHDWDAIFSGLESPSAAAATPATAPAADKPAGGDASRPGQQPLNRTESEQDDPILKSLTGMGYQRTDALAALEKFDYDLDKVCFARCFISHA